MWEREGTTAESQHSHAAPKIQTPRPPEIPPPLRSSGLAGQDPRGSRTLKAPQVQKTAHPSPAHPSNPCPAFKPPSSGRADQAHRGSQLPRLQPRKNNFQSIQHPRPPSPPCKRNLPKTLCLSLGRSRLSKETADTILHLAL